MKFLNKSMLLLVAVCPALWVSSLAADEKPGAAKKLPEVAKFFLSGDKKFGIDPPKEGQVAVGLPARIKVVAGLSDPARVSLMTDRNVYLRHQFWKLQVQKRPEKEEDKKSFDEDATYVVTYLPNGDVKFEAANRPGEFIAVEMDGKFILSKPMENLRMDFRAETK